MKFNSDEIASVIKQPEPSATHKGFDPQNNPTDAKSRWDYTLGNMVEKDLWVFEWNGTTLRDTGQRIRVGGGSAAVRTAEK